MFTDKVRRRISNTGVKLHRGTDHRASANVVLCVNVQSKKIETAQAGSGCFYRHIGIVLRLKRFNERLYSLMTAALFILEAG